MGIENECPILIEDDERVIPGNHNLFEGQCCRCPLRETVRQLADELKAATKLLIEFPGDPSLSGELGILEDVLRSTLMGCPRLPEPAEAPKTGDIQPEVYKPRFSSTCPKKIIRWARDQGFEIKKGQGRHPVHICVPGGPSVPVPSHPGDLPTGTAKSIIKWIDDKSGSVKEQA